VKWTTALNVLHAAVCVVVQKNCYRGQCYRSVQYDVWCAEVGTFVAAVIICRDRKMRGKFNWRVRSVCVTQFLCTNNAGPMF